MPSKGKKPVVFTFFLLLMITMLNAAADNSLSTAGASPFSPTELNTIKKYLFNNITTNDTTVVKESDGQTIHSIPGAVLASPTNKGKAFSQDYQFHWVRDAAISMYEVALLYTQSSAQEKEHLNAYLQNYINFERKAQSQISKQDEETLGQPKFNIDGTIWEGKWTRPQNDGPALRAITLTFIATIFLQEGREKFVRDIMLPMIQTDLDYSVSHWQTTNFDLWEEVSDTNLFFTQMVQRKALMEGSTLFKKLGDKQRASSYVKTANQITFSLKKHWNASRGYLTETVHQQYFKGGGINTSIILGALLGDLHDTNDEFAVNSDEIMSSIYYTRNAFARLYRVNIDNPHHPPILGRYPNDIYDGDQFIYGNPWIVTTTALAQYYYTLANVLLNQAKITINKTNILFS